VVDQLFKKHNFPKPNAVKTLATGETQHGNQQFESIDQIQQSDQGPGNTVMSMDIKKRIHWAVIPRGTTVHPGNH
jgi:hypothetical protein